MTEQLCDVCGKPVGKYIPGAKVSHWECAYKAAEKPRKKLQKRLKNAPPQAPAKYKQ